MTYSRHFFSLAFLAWAVIAQAQSALGPEQIVRKALDTSPTVQAQFARMQARLQQAKSLGSGFNPEIEIAPGFGFTNSNFALGQTFDISGRRSAQRRAADAIGKWALADLLKSRLQVAELVLSTYANYLWAVELDAAANQGVKTAEDILAGVHRRVELGEAAAVLRTRAEIELLRAQQAQVEASARLTSSLAALNSSLGVPSNDKTAVAGWLTSAPKSTDLTDALARRPEMLSAQARIEEARAGEDEARSLGRPSLFAGVAADTWSLDRDSFRSANLGFQISLKMPLIDRGENRFAAHAAEFTRKAHEADLLDVERQVKLEMEQASIAQASASKIAASYASGIIPKAEEMLTSMRQGYESGLVNFLEVLEAQQTLARLRREAADATHALRLAEVRYLAAIAQLPGLETTQS